MNCNFKEAWNTSEVSLGINGGYFNVPIPFQGLSNGTDSGFGFLPKVDKHNESNTNTKAYIKNNSSALRVT